MNPELVEKDEGYLRNMLYIIGDELQLSEETKEHLWREFENTFYLLEAKALFRSCSVKYLVALNAHAFQIQSI